MKQATDSPIEARVREIATQVADSTGLELVLLEFGRAGGRAIVRLTIDKEGGVTLEDCASYSRRVGAVLEIDDPIPSAYSLEVSSPGLDRRLVKPDDYVRFQGKPIRVSLTSPLAGRRNFRGVLKGLEGTDILLELEAGQLARLPLESVDKARLVPEF